MAGAPCSRLDWAAVRKPHVGELRNGVGVRGEVSARVEINELVGEKRQRSFGGGGGILLSQAARGGVTRVRELLQSRRRLLSFISKVASRQEHLATNLDATSPLSLQLGGHVLDGEHVWVTSSPTRPSPRVAARTSWPST